MGRDVLVIFFGCCCDRVFVEKGGRISCFWGGGSRGGMVLVLQKLGIEGFIYGRRKLRSSFMSGFVGIR